MDTVTIGIIGIVILVTLFLLRLPDLSGLVI
jgi:hypothetical protein